MYRYVPGSICVLQPRMFDPLSPLKSTLVIHSPLSSTTNLLLQVHVHMECHELSHVSAKQSQ